MDLNWVPIFQLILGLKYVHIPRSRYFTFYNSADDPFSNFYPATVELNGTLYKTVEHCWQAAKYGCELETPVVLVESSVENAEIMENCP